MRNKATLVSSLIVVLLQVTPAARAGPLFSARTGGVALVGPASGHPMSLIFNPAALGLFSGSQLYLGGTAEWQATTVRRAPTDSTTGEPTGALAGGSIDQQSGRTVNPELRVVGISDLGSDALVFGIALYNRGDNVSLLRPPSAALPSESLVDAAAQGPNRYHGTNLRLQQLYLPTLAAAVRVTKNWHIGLSLSYVLNDVDFGFVRDTALDGGTHRSADEPVALDDCGEAGVCGYGSDAASESVRVSGRSGGLAFGLGLLAQLHRTVRVGIGYASPVVDPGGSTITASGTAWVRRSAATCASADCDPARDAVGPGTRNLRGRGVVRFQSPDIVSAGLTWQALRRVALDFQLRWILFSRHDRLDVRLSGVQFRDPPQVPDRVVHYRGFHDVIATQLGASVNLHRLLDLQLAAMVANGAVRQSAINGIAIDNWKVDGLVALRWRAAVGWALDVGYAIELLPTAEVTNSAFHPSSFANCVDSRFNVELADCREAIAGRGMASTAGRYSRIGHRLGLGIGYRWR